MKYKIIFLVIIILLEKFYKNKKKLIIKNKKKLIKKGKYLTLMANCISCHTIEGGKPFSGGNVINTNFGKLYTPNITSKFFIKNNINLKKFLKIIRLGISEKNNFLYPVLPYINYYKIKKKDISLIYFFLRTIPKTSIKNKNNSIIFPFKYKKLLLFWRLLFFKKNIFYKLYKIKNIINRGKYLTETLGHCNMCHTQINIFGSNIKKLNYKGNFIKKKIWYAKEIVNNSLKGIKKKNVKNIINILKYGFSSKKKIIGNMSEVINNSLQYIDKIEIKSISKYIKTLFNKKKYIRNIKLIKIKKIFSKNFFEKGKLLYKKNCQICHGKLKFGNIIFPKLLKKINYKELINFSKTTKTNIKINLWKNNFTTFMPSFINFLNKKKYNYLLYYFFYIKKLI